MLSVAVDGTTGVKFDQVATVAPCIAACRFKGVSQCGCSLELEHRGYNAVKQ